MKMQKPSLALMLLAGAALSACGGDGGSSSQTASVQSSSSEAPVASSSESAFSSLSSSSSESSTSSSSSSSTQSSSAASVGADLIISDDFEGAAAGEVPPGWRTILGYGLVDFSRTPDAGSAAEIDSSQAHSGSNSVKISTPNAMAPHFIFQELPSNLTRLYVRAWVYTAAAIGGGSPGGAGDHAHFIGTIETPGQDSGAELRFGANQRAYLGGFMPTYGDAFTNIQTSGSIPANTWTCVEWAVVDEPDFDHMYIWLNDEQIMAAEAQGDWQNGPRADFVNADSTKYISFGWRQFGSVADVSSIWFDDIAVGTTKIGCE